MTSTSSSTPTLPTYRLLGSSSLRVHPLCLGTMQFGENELYKSLGVSSTKEEAENLYKTYIQSGGNFIDTANFYQGGQSEAYLGDFIQKYNNVASRESLVIATKYSLSMNPFDPNASGNHKKNLVQSVTKSLERLKTDYIDLLYVHYWDFSTDTEQLMRSLDDVVRSGKVLHVAISDTPAWEVAQANTFAKLRGWSPFVGYQGRYNLVDRAAEQEILPMCQKLNIGFVPWGVLGSGKLSGKHTRQGTAEGAKRIVKGLTEEEFKVQDELIQIAQETGLTPAQVALNFVVNQPGVTSAIVGPSKVSQLTESFKALEVTLTKEQVNKLKEASSNLPGKIFPHNFLGTNPQNTPWLYGGFSLADRKFNIAPSN